MVAAWICADTGVGPAMASGSQTISGTCADLPMAPSRSKSPKAVITPWTAQVPHLVQLGNGEGIKEFKHPDDGYAQPDIADAGNDKRFAACRGVFRFLVPKPDKGIRTETDPFPTKVEQRQILGQTKTSMAPVNRLSRAKNRT